MPISALSRVQNIARYIDPIDTEALSKGLLYKQERFDKGVQAVQSQVNTYKGIVDTLIRDDDRKYLQGKIDTYINDINKKYGSSDFSDLNTLSDISAMGATIYKDDKVLGDIKDSKAVTSLITNIQKLKTDPKLMDRYSYDNEKWDMRYVNEYLSKPGSRYRGSSTPTPYFDVDKKMNEALSKVKDDMQTILGQDGYMHYISGIGKEKIANIAKGIIDRDPRISHQMMINQWSKYSDSLPENVIGEANGYLNQKREALARSIQALDDRKKQYKSDSKEVGLLNQQITNLTNSLGQLRDFTSKDEASAFLYKNQYVDGLVEQYSRNQQKTVADQTFLSRARMEMQKSQFDSMMNFRYKELDWKILSGNRNYELARAKFEYDQKTEAAKATGKEVTPIYTGLDPELQPFAKLQEAEQSVTDLQMKNQQLMAETMLQIIVGNDPTTVKEYDTIKRALGQYVNNPTNAIQGLIQDPRVSLTMKNRLKTMGFSMAKTLMNVSNGSLPISALANQPGYDKIAKTLNEMQENYASAIMMQQDIAQATDKALAKQGIRGSDRKKMVAEVSSMRRNPSLIPSQYFDQAMRVMNIPMKVEEYMNSGILSEQERREFRSKLTDQAIKIYQHDKYNFSPDDLSKDTAGFLDDTKFLRKSYTFPEKLDENSSRALRAGAIKYVTTENQAEARTQNLHYNGFTLNPDGSYKISYQTEVKDKEGNKSLGDLKSFTIPASDAQLVNQFLPKGFDTQLRQDGLQRMVNKNKGIYDINGNPLMLTTEKIPLPYTITAYDINNPNDNSVQVQFQYSPTPNSIPQWVGAFSYPNVETAKLKVQEMVDRLHAAGVAKNMTVPQLIMELTKESRRR